MAHTYHENSNIVSADGHKLGTLQQLVIDPQTREVSHLTIDQGFFDEDKVIPISLVGEVTESEIVLSQSAGTLDLEPFRKTDYVSPDEMYDSPMFATRNVLYAHTPAMALGSWRQPYFPLWQSSEEVDDNASVGEKNIPDDAVTLHENATVYSIEDEKLGTISEFIVDTNTDQISHIVVEKGFFFTTTKAIPVDWIRTSGGEVIRLNVEVSALEKLPEYEGNHDELTLAD